MINHPQDSIEEIIDDFMYPVIVFVVQASFNDGTHKFYTFSDEEKQVDFVEYIQNNMDSLGIVEAQVSESILDFDARDGDIFTIH